MNKRNTEKKLSAAFGRLSPDDFGAILRDVEAGRTVDIPAEPKKVAHIRKIVAAVAALAVISGTLFGIYAYNAERGVAAAVSIDVNPAVVIKVNSKEKVIHITSKNGDGESLIGDRDFTGCTLEYTVDTLVTEMLKQGYISEMSNSVLVSVGGSSPERNTEITSRLAHNIGKHIEADGISGAVMSQTVDDATLAETAENYGITEGKAQLIKRIIDGGNNSSFEQLARLSINELSLIAGSDRTNVSDVEQIGSPSDKAYVGEENAVSAALDHAGIVKDEADAVDADIDAVSGAMVYKVDLNYSGKDYGITVDAVSGTVIKFSPAEDLPEPPKTDTVTDPVTEKTHAPESTVPKTEPPVTAVTEKPEPLPVNITEDEVRLITARHANADCLTDYTCTLSYDGTVPVYTVSFHDSALVRYDHTVNANDGTVISFASAKDPSYSVRSRTAFVPSAFPEGYNRLKYSGYSLQFLTPVIDGAIGHTATENGSVLYVVDSLKKLRQVTDAIAAADPDFDGNPAAEAKALIADLENYGEDFFAENTLYILSMHQKDSNVDFSTAVSVDSGKLCITAKKDPVDRSIMLPKYAVYLFEIGNTSTQGITEVILKAE